MKRTETEIKQLAKDIKNNLVFTDRHIREGDLENMLPSIFMVLLLMDDETSKKLQDDKPYLFYEYYDKASPRSINGYPSFFSLQYLDKEDTIQCFDILKKLEDAENAILGDNNE